MNDSLFSIGVEPPPEVFPNPETEFISIHLQVTIANCKCGAQTIAHQEVMFKVKSANRNLSWLTTAREREEEFLILYDYLPKQRVDVVQRVNVCVECFNEFPILEVDG